MTSIFKTLTEYYEKLSKSEEEYKRAKAQQERREKLEEDLESLNTVINNIVSENQDSCEKIGRYSKKFEMKPHALAGFVYYRWFKAERKEIESIDWFLSNITDSKFKETFLEYAAFPEKGEAGKLERKLEQLEEIRKKLEQLAKLSEDINSNFKFDFSEEINIVELQIKRVNAREIEIQKLLKLVKKVDRRCETSKIREKILKLAGNTEYREELPDLHSPPLQFTKDSRKPKTQEDLDRHNRRVELLDERKTAAEEYRNQIKDSLNKLSQIIKDRDSAEEEIEKLQKYEFNF